MNQQIVAPKHCPFFCATLSQSIICADLISAETATTYCVETLSSKPIAQKLQIKENFSVLLVNEPEGYGSMLGKLLAGVTVSTEPNKPFDVIQVFLTSKKELENQLAKLKSTLKPKGILWVTYPKGTSKVRTDVNRDIIRQYAQKIGLQAVAMVSIDETWSALRLKIA